jgi:hypothetical protein
VARRGDDVDGAAVQFDDLARDGEAQARAFALLIHAC